jgi:hypothetical protein
MAIPYLKINSIGGIGYHKDRLSILKERSQHRPFGGITAEKRMPADSDKVAKLDFAQSDLLEKVRGSSQDTSKAIETDVL